MFETNERPCVDLRFGQMPSISGLPCLFRVNREYLDARAGTLGYKQSIRELYEALL